MPAILLAEGRRYEPVKVSAETAKTVRFKVALDLTDHAVRWEIVDRIAGKRVTLQEATSLVVTDAGTEAASSEFDVELGAVDTVVAGPHLLRITAEDADGSPVEVPGGLVEVEVSGPNRTLTLGYFNERVSEAKQAELAAAEHRDEAAEHRDGADDARGGAEDARDEASSARDEAEAKRALAAISAAAAAGTLNLALLVQLGVAPYADAAALAAAAPTDGALGYVTGTALLFRGNGAAWEVQAPLAPVVLQTDADIPAAMLRPGTKVWTTAGTPASTHSVVDDFDEVAVINRHLEGVAEATLVAAGIVATAANNVRVVRDVTDDALDPEWAGAVVGATPGEATMVANRAAMAAQLQVIRERGGGTLRLGPGRFEVRAASSTGGSSYNTLYLDDLHNVVIEGAGKGRTVLYTTPNGYVNQVNRDVHGAVVKACSNIVLKDLTLSLGRNEITGSMYTDYGEQRHGVRVEGSSGLYFLNVEFKDMISDAVQSTRNGSTPCGDFFFSYCTFTNCGRSGVSLRSAQRVWYDHCTSANVADQHISAESGDADFAPIDIYVSFSRIDGSYADLGGGVINGSATPVALDGPLATNPARRISFLATQILRGKTTVAVSLTKMAGVSFTSCYVEGSVTMLGEVSDGAFTDSTFVYPWATAPTDTGVIYCTADASRTPSRIRVRGGSIRIERCPTVSAVRFHDAANVQVHDVAITYVRANTAPAVVFAFTAATARTGWHYEASKLRITGAYRGLRLSGGATRQMRDLRMQESTFRGLPQATLGGLAPHLPTGTTVTSLRLLSLAQGVTAGDTLTVADAGGGVQTFTVATTTASSGSAVSVPVTSTTTTARVAYGATVYRGATVLGTVAPSSLPAGATVDVVTILPLSRDLDVGETIRVVDASSVEQTFTVATAAVPSTTGAAVAVAVTSKTVPNAIDSGASVYVAAMAMDAVVYLPNGWDFVDLTQPGGIPIWQGNLTGDNVTALFGYGANGSLPGVLCVGGNPGGALSIADYSGLGLPGTIGLAAPVGSTYRNRSGGTGTTMHLKETGTTSAGWVAK